MGHPGCAGLVPGPGARASDSVSPAPCLVTDPCWHSSTPAIRQLNVGQPGLALQWGHVAVARTSHWGPVSKAEPGVPSRPSCRQRLAPGHWRALWAKPYNQRLTVPERGDPLSVT